MGYQFLILWDRLFQVLDYALAYDYLGSCLYLEARVCDVLASGAEILLDLLYRFLKRLLWGVCYILYLALH